MPLLLVKVHFTVDTSSSEMQAKEQLEYALNQACFYLEQHLTKASIAYKIREIDEI